MKRDPWKPVYYVWIVVFWVGWASLAFGQLPPQPGDTPPPVVRDSRMAEEAGFISAVITGPQTVQAGRVLVLNVSGTSDGDTDLTFMPAVPDAAIQYDSNGDLVYVWIDIHADEPVGYVATLSVRAGGRIAAAAVGVMVLPAGTGPPPDGPDPPPGDTALLKYVQGLTQKVEAENHAEISATFRSLAKRMGPVKTGTRAPGIDVVTPAELVGSAKIQAATLDALFGKARTLNPEWGDWYNQLFPHLLNVKPLATQKQWQAAYEVVARGIHR